MIKISEILASGNMVIRTQKLAQFIKVAKYCDTFKNDDEESLKFKFETNLDETCIRNIDYGSEEDYIYVFKSVNFQIIPFEEVDFEESNLELVEENLSENENNEEFRKYLVTGNVIVWKDNAKNVIFTNDTWINSNGLIEGFIIENDSWIKEIYTPKKLFDWQNETNKQVVWTKEDYSWYTENVFELLQNNCFNYEYCKKIDLYCAILQFNQKFDSEYEFVEESKNYLINYLEGEVEVDYVEYGNDITSIYFSTEEIANKCLEFLKAKELI